MTGPGARGGRRPGSPDTRSAILDAARARFAAQGMRGTTVRAVATDAGVDPALVHHYFGTKQDLFLAAADLPVDPVATLEVLTAAPFPELGPTMVRTVLTMWASEAGPGLLARFRTSLATDGGEEVADVLHAAPLRLLTERLTTELELPPDAAERRASLAMSALIGLVAERHLLGFPAVAALGVDDLVEAVGPTVQAHLEGRIPV